MRRWRRARRARDSGVAGRVGWQMVGEWWRVVVYDDGVGSKGDDDRRDGSEDDDPAETTQPSEGDDGRS